MNLVILNKSFGDVVLFFDGMLLQDYWCETTGYVVGKIFSSGHYGSFATDWAVRNCCPVSRRKRIDTVKLCPTFKVGHSFGPEKKRSHFFSFGNQHVGLHALGRFCLEDFVALPIHSSVFPGWRPVLFSEAFAVAFQCLRPLPPFAGG